MTLATEKTKLASEKFYLVRIEPSRYISESVASAGGGLYTLTFAQPVSKVLRNGTILTEDSAIPTVNDHWYYDEATQVLTVKLAATPNSTTNVLTMDYQLFFTENTGRILYEDPTTSSGTQRMWEPRLQGRPSISQSVRNILQGKLTITSTNVELINIDNYFNQFLTVDDSFSNKDIDIWMGINGSDSIGIIFKGLIASITAGDKFVLNVKDILHSLQQPAYMGDTEDEAYYYNRTGSFPSMQPKHDGKPCPFVINRSNYSYRAGAGAFALLGIGTETSAYTLDPTEMEEAVCTDFSSAPTVTTNRDWHTCRIGAMKAQDLGTVVSKTYRSTAVVKYNLDGYGRKEGSPLNFSSIRIVTDAHNIEIGDTFRAFSSGLLHYCIVVDITATTVDAVIMRDDTVSAVDTVGWASSNIILNEGIGLTWTQNNEEMILVHHRDYFVSTSATSSGNTLVEINLVNDFEDHFKYNPPAAPATQGVDTLNPNKDTIHFRISDGGSSGSTHGNILKKIITDQGLAVDVATFTAADSAFSSQCNFSIPYFNSTYSSSLSYAEKILASTFGYLYMDTSLQVGYNLFSTPSSTDVRDHNTIQHKGVSSSIEYQDIITGVNALNNFMFARIPDATRTDIYAASDNKAIYLHETENTYQLEHVLETIGTRAQSILDTLSNRKIVYTIRTLNEDIDSIIGEDIQVISDKIFDVDVLKIIGLTKQLNKTTIKALDLEGL